MQAAYLARMPQGKLKQFRRVATRYDKPDPHYLAFVQLASILLWFRASGDVA